MKKPTLAAAILALLASHALPALAQSHTAIRAQCQMAAEHALGQPRSLFGLFTHQGRVNRYIQNCIAAGGPIDTPVVRYRSQRQRSTATTRIPFDHALRQCRSQSRMVFGNNQFMRDQAERDCLRTYGY